MFFKKLINWRSNKEYLKGRTVVPLYEPPSNLPAAEVGLLVDQKGGRMEFLATIYQLKTKRIISLSRAADESVMLKLLQYPQLQLTSYEDLLLRYLFHESKEVMLSSFFERTNFAVVQAYFQYLVMQTLQSKGLLFIEEGYESQPYEEYLRKVAENPFKYALDYLKNGVSKNITTEFTELYPQLAGFKQYIETAELDKIKFHAKGNLETYIELLTPYAIALNQMERWRIIGIPLIVFKIELSTQPEYQPVVDKPADIYDETLAMIKVLDSYTITDLIMK